MQFDWPYYTLRNGKLYDERMVDRHGKCIPASGTPDGKTAPQFANAAEAEAWLEANDIRGSVQAAS